MKLLDIPTMRFVGYLRMPLCVAALVLSSATAAAPREQAEPVAASCSSGKSVLLAGAAFIPRREGEDLAWDARFIVDVDAAFDFQGGAVPFAIPLPEGETLIPTPGIAPVFEGTRMIGLCVTPEAIHDRTIAASFLQPLARTATSTKLGAPVAAGNVVQIVDTALGDAQLDITGSELIEKHVGYSAARGVSHAAREEARRLTDVRARIDRSPLYVRGDDVLAASGVSARIAGPPARRSANMWGVLLVFGSVVGALVATARKLRRTADIEHADALLAEEIDATTKGTRG
jgi:hypothetical protein